MAGPHEAEPSPATGCPPARAQEAKNWGPRTAASPVSIHSIHIQCFIDVPPPLSDTCDRVLRDLQGTGAGGKVRPGWRFRVGPPSPGHLALPSLSSSLLLTLGFYPENLPRYNKC